MSNQKEEVTYSLNKGGLARTGLSAGIMLGRAASVGDIFAKGLGEPIAGPIVAGAVLSLDIATSVARAKGPFFGRLAIEGLNTAVTAMAVTHTAHVMGVQPIPGGVIAVAAASTARELVPGLHAVGPHIFNSPARITEEDGE